MVLVDVNVLVYAHREDAKNHQAYRIWLKELVNFDQSFGMPDLVQSGFLRIVTHPRVFAPPSTLDQVLAFTQDWVARPLCADYRRPAPLRYLLPLVQRGGRQR